MSSLLRRGLATAAAVTITATTAAAVAVAASPGSQAADPVLGSPSYMAPYGEGWGTAHPVSVFNGGDPSGSADHLAWRHWGEAKAKATGTNPIFRPGGGYYRRPGTIVFRATRLGTCDDGTYGYTRLEFKVSRTPRGPVVGPWRAWSGDADVCG